MREWRLTMNENSGVDDSTKITDIEPTCSGQCIFGKCPFVSCIKKMRKTENVPPKTDIQILTQTSISQVDLDFSGFGIAVDIGTTTVVAALYRLETGEQIAVDGKLNSQTAYGLDVISRIKFASENSEGLKTLSSAIVGDINSLFNKFSEYCELSEIKRIVITGNTTMLHLLCGLSPENMGQSPFTPTSLFGIYERSETLGLCCKKADIFLTDCISAFVGGDITSAVLAADLSNLSGVNLLLDIGTNGEVALSVGGTLYVTSTAAGPAFEGATLSCGMAGVAGAISGVEIIDGTIALQTIGNIKPSGICGSGATDAVAVMLEIGIIGENGAFNGGAFLQSQYYTCNEKQSAFSLSENVYITQRDIREIQMAKAAISAGVLALLAEAGKELSDVKTVFLSGGFGNYLNVDSAIRIGLLPQVCIGKIVPIGNGALAGAALALLNDKKLEELEKIVQSAKTVELSTNAYFMEKYVEEMGFL